jgi:hypothetical protein
MTKIANIAKFILGTLVGVGMVAVIFGFMIVLG